MERVVGSKLGFFKIRVAVAVLRAVRAEPEETCVFITMAIGILITDE